jgi:hypothetical protein
MLQFGAWASGIPFEQSEEFVERQSFDMHFGWMTVVAGDSR